MVGGDFVGGEMVWWLGDQIPPGEWGAVYGRFVYESFHQHPVRQLVKSFHVRVGSVP